MKLTIPDDELDKLNQLFKSDNIGLAIQLIKSLSYELEDVLRALYDKYNYISNDDMNWFVLNAKEHYHPSTICIRYCEDIVKPYCLWGGDLDTKVYDLDELTLEPCITRLANILREHYDK